MQNTPSLLDCTIRDGGYLNNWDFSFDFVFRMLRVLDETGFSFAEIGFWNPRKSGQAWCHCSIENLRKLRCEDLVLKLSLLIDFRSCTADEIPDELMEVVGLLRVASRKEDLAEAAAFAAKLSNRGFKVTLNAMGITSYSPSDLLFLARIASENANVLEYLYIADSFGGLTPSRTEDILRFLRTASSVKLGFHPHNNLELAVANTLVSIEAGAEIVDSSILGLGRGGGNLRSEVIACVLSSLRNNHWPRPLPVLSFADATWDQLGSKLNIRYDLEQIISGMALCHPNYALMLIGPRRLALDEVHRAIVSIPVADRARFSEETLNAVISGIEDAASHKTSSLCALRKTAHTRSILICPGATDLAEETDPATPVFSVNWFPTKAKVNAAIFGSVRRLWQMGDRSEGTPAFLLSNKSELLSLPPHLNLDDSVVAAKLGQILEDSGIRALAVLFEAGYSHVDVYGMDGFSHVNDSNESINQLQRAAEKELALIREVYEARGCTFEIHES